MQVFSEPSIYRDIALSIYVAAFLFGIQFIIHFISDWKNSKIATIRDIRIGWAGFIALAVLHLFFFMIGDFYATPIDREFWLKLGYVALLAGLFVFSYIFEASYKKSRHIFSIIFMIGTILSIILPHELLRKLAIGLFTPFLIVELYLYIKFMMRYAYGKVRKNILLFISSFIMILIGYAFMTDYAIDYLGLPSYTFGTILLAGGIIGMGQALMNIPSFDELNWEKMAKELYVMTRDGRPLLKIDFEKPQEEMSDETILATGGFTGIREILKEIVHTDEEIRVVDQGNIKLLFAHSPHLVGVLVTQKALETLYEKLDDTISRFELIYGDMMENWDGNLSRMGPAKKIALANFGFKQLLRK